MKDNVCKPIPLMGYIFHGHVFLMALVKTNMQASQANNHCFCFSFPWDRIILITSKISNHLPVLDVQPWKLVLQVFES